MLEGEEGFCNFLYQGQDFDKDVNLAYNRFRWYDQEEGIYISQDPIGIEGGQAIYSYVTDPNSWIDAFGLTETPAERAAGKGYPGAKMNNKGNLTFKDSNYLYNPKDGQKNIVKVKLTGNYDKDFRAANKAAGLKTKPNGYTWHHVDYNPKTGKGTMELVETKAHKASVPLHFTRRFPDKRYENWYFSFFGFTAAIEK